MKQFKKRWGIQSNFQLVLILLVFAINGSFAAWVAEPATNLIGLDKATTNTWIFWPVRIVLVFFIYQITLPLVGLFFGQFEFFWSFSKKMYARMALKRFF